MRRQTLQRLGMSMAGLLACSGVAGAQHWLEAPEPPSSFSAGSIALLLTDGTIMVQQSQSANWWKLTPDEHANYNTGTWSQLASSVWPNGQGGLVVYGPKDFASAVLKDGRVIVMGGEYLAFAGKVDTKLGAIFDPTKGPLDSAGRPIGTWTPVKAPGGWTKIGDAPSVVLPDGRFMLGICCGPPQAALLDASLNWTVLTDTKGGGYAGKYDNNNEEGWTLLPNGDVLTVDTYQNAPDMAIPGGPGTLPNNSELYHPGPVTDPGAGTWTSAGNTIKPLSQLQAICPRTSSGGYVTGGHEVGPAILRPDSTVFATGVYACGTGEGGGGGAGHTAIYNTNGGSNGFWTAGPDIPCTGEGANRVCNDMADAPAALLPTGNVLVQTSPGINKGSSTFWEFDLYTNTFSPNPAPFPPHFSSGSSEPGRMLVLPSGHIFYMHGGASTDEMGFYVPQGTYEPGWAPSITHVTDNGICVGCIDRGQTYVVSGTQLNGLSQGAAYGDDAQDATNYPLVLIENCQTGKKTFARTHDFSTMAVATGLLVVTAQFTVSPETDLGASSLTVITNGIPSQPYGTSKCFMTVEPEVKGN